MDIAEKIQQIQTIIVDISQEDPAVGGIFMEGFGLSLNLLREAINRQGADRESIDLSEHLEIIERVLGISVSRLVQEAMTSLGVAPTDINTSTKEPDAETLSFITAGTDDYEQFIKENSVTDNLSYLANTLK